MALKALIFGVDGTLAETSELRRAAYNRAFEEYSLGWFWTRTMFQNIQDNAPPEREIEFFAAKHSPVLFRILKEENQLPALREFQEKYYLDLIDAGAAPLRPGVARLIAGAMSGGLKIILVSARRRVEYESLVYKHFGLEIIAKLKTSVAREDLPAVSVLKAYELALHRLDLDPKEVIILDHGKDGIAAARRLGTRSIAVPSAQTAGQNFDLADLVISDFGHPVAPFDILKGTYAGPAHLTIAGLRIWLLSQKILVEDAA